MMDSEPQASLLGTPVLSLKMAASPRSDVQTGSWVAIPYCWCSSAVHAPVQTTRHRQLQVHTFVVATALTIYAGEPLFTLVSFFGLSFSLSFGFSFTYTVFAKGRGSGASDDSTSPTNVSQAASLNQPSPVLHYLTFHAVSVTAASSFTYTVIRRLWHFRCPIP